MPVPPSPVPTPPPIGAPQGGNLGLSMLRDPRIDMLVDAITQSITGGGGQNTPQPPPVPQMPVPANAGLVAARNPEMLGPILQRIASPSTMAYQGQMEAFKQQMENRRAGLRAGEGLSQLLATLPFRYRPIVEENELFDQKTGQRQKIRVYRDPITQQETGREVVGQLPPRLQFAPSMTGAGGILNLDTGQYSELGRVGKSDETAAQHLESLNAAEQDLKQMEALLDTATQRHTAAARLGTSFLHDIPGIRKGVGYLGDVGQLQKTHEAIREKMVAELNPLVTGQNRLLGSVVEQFLNYIPDFSENPAVYKATLANARRSLAQARALMSELRPREAAAAGRAAQVQYGTPPSSGESFDDSLRRVLGPNVKP